MSNGDAQIKEFSEKVNELIKKIEEAKHPTSHKASASAKATAGISSDEYGHDHSKSTGHKIKLCYGICMVEINYKPIFEYIDEAKKEITENITKDMATKKSVDTLQRTVAKYHFTQNELFWHNGQNFSLPRRQAGAYLSGKHQNLFCPFCSNHFILHQKPIWQQSLQNRWTFLLVKRRKDRKKRLS